MTEQENTGRDIVKKHDDWGDDDGLGFRGNDLVKGHRADGSSRRGVHVAQNTGIVRPDWNVKPAEEQPQADQADTRQVARREAYSPVDMVLEADFDSAEGYNEVLTREQYDQYYAECRDFANYLGPARFRGVVDLVEGMTAENQALVVHALAAGGPTWKAQDPGAPLAAMTDWLLEHTTDPDEIRGLVQSLPSEIRQAVMG